MLVGLRNELRKRFLPPPPPELNGTNVAVGAHSDEIGANNGLSNSISLVGPSTQSNILTVASPPMPPALGHQNMFSNPFSFSGRIRRLEYGLSYIIYEVWSVLIALVIGSIIKADAALILYYLFLTPGMWFLLAQGTKRCHDRGNSGWYQLIPFYGLVMLFGEGDYGTNEYGLDPKR